MEIDQGKEGDRVTADTLIPNAGDQHSPTHWHRNGCGCEVVWGGLDGSQVSVTRGLWMVMVVVQWIWERDVTHA